MGIHTRESREHQVVDAVHAAKSSSAQTQHTKHPNHSQSHVKRQRKADDIPKQQVHRPRNANPEQLALLLPICPHPRARTHKLLHIHPVLHRLAHAQIRVVRLAEDGEADDGRDAVEDGDDDEDPFDADALRNEAAADGADDGAEEGAAGRGDVGE